MIGFIIAGGPHSIPDEFQMLADSKTKGIERAPAGKRTSASLNAPPENNGKRGARPYLPASVAFKHLPDGYLLVFNSASKAAKGLWEKSESGVSVEVERPS